MATRIAGITIEIGGDTTKLQSALKGVDGSLKTTQNGLKDVNKLLKLDPKNITLLKQKQEYLSSAIKDTSEKLKIEKEALQQMKDANTTGEVTEQQKALEREVAETEKKLQTLKKEYKDFGDAAAQAIKEAGKNIKDVGDKTQQTGKDITTHVTAPIVAGFGAAVKTTADYEEQMSKVQAITGASGDDMDTLKKKAREMGAKTKFSATEAGQAMEYMGMAGWKTTDIVDGLEGIMNLAAASGEDLGTTSDIVTDALTAFGLEAKDSGHFADVLAAASTGANTNVSMLGESFKYVAPVAGAMGYSVEDVTTALGLMANSGIKASSAGTSLRTLLTNMAKPTDAVAIAMEDLGVSLDDGEGNMKSFDEVMKDLRKGFGKTKIPADELEKGLSDLETAFENGEITEKQYNKQTEALMGKAYGAEGALKAKTAAALAGKTGMSGLLAIVNASEEDFEKLSKAIKTSSDETDGYNGQAEKMAGVMQDNLNGQLTILMSQIQELAISIGESLMPTVKDIVGKIQDAVDWLNSLDQSQKDMIIKIGLVVAAIGPLLVVVGTVISSIGTIVGAVGGLIGLITGGSGAVAAAGAATTAVEGVTAAVGTTAAGGGLIATLGGLVTAAAPFLIGGAVVVGIIAAVALIVKNWDKIKAGAKKLVEDIKVKWNDFKKKTSETFKNIADTAKQKFDSAKTAAINAANNLKTTVSTRFTEAKTAISTAASDIANKVKEKFEDAKTKATNAIGDMKTSVSSKFSDVKTAVSTATSDIAKKVKEKFDAAKSDASSAVKSLAEKVSDKFDDAKTDAKAAVEKIYNNVKDYLGDAASEADDESGDIKKSISDNIGDAAYDAVAGFKDIASNAKSKLHDAAVAASDRGYDVARHLQDSIGNKINDVKDDFATLADTTKSKLYLAAVHASNQGAEFMRALKKYAGNSLSDFIDNIGDIPGEVKSALDGAKDKLSDFTWKFPQPSMPRMPHIKLKYNEFTFGGKTYKYPTGFTTEWYAKAYTNPVMFTRPTVLQTPQGSKGFGDRAGGEIVLSDRKLREIAGSGETNYNINIYGAAGQDVNALADAVQNRLVALQRQREAAGLA